MKSATAKRTHKRVAAIAQSTGKQPRPPRPPRPSPPIVSDGNRDIALLEFLRDLRTEHGNARFNIRQYSKISGVPRSSISTILKRLIRQGLVVKICTGHYLISDTAFLHKNRVAAYGRRGGRGATARNTLSTHAITYKCDFEKSKPITRDTLEALNPIAIKDNKLPNFTAKILYFENATITIYLRKIRIRVNEIQAEDTEEAHFQAFSRATELVDLLDKNGILCANMALEYAHYERMASHLACFLSRIDNHYSLELSSGRKIWIDYSPNSEGPPNDETNDAEVRERIDSFLEDVTRSKSTLSDVDKLKEVVGYLVLLRTLELKPAGVSESQTRPDYIN